MVLMFGSAQAQQGRICNGQPLRCQAPMQHHSVGPLRGYPEEWKQNRGITSSPPGGLSWGPGDHFPTGTLGEVDMANALGGVSLPADRALEVEAVQQRGVVSGVEEGRRVSPLLCAGHFTSSWG